MSQENVEVVRAASRRGTRGTWTPFVSLIDPDVIVRRWKVGRSRDRT